MDDLDSKMGAVRAALAIDSGEPEWSAYSGALGRKFLRLDKFLKKNHPRSNLECGSNAAAFEARSPFHKLAC